MNDDRKLSEADWRKLPAVERIKRHPYPGHNYPCCDCVTTAQEAVSLLQRIVAHSLPDWSGTHGRVVQISEEMYEVLLDWLEGRSDKKDIQPHVDAMMRGEGRP